VRVSDGRDCSACAKNGSMSGRQPTECSLLGRAALLLTLATGCGSDTSNDRALFASGGAGSSAGGGGVGGSGTAGSGLGGVAGGGAGATGVAGFNYGPGGGGANGFTGVGGCSAVPPSSSGASGAPSCEPVGTWGVDYGTVVYGSFANTCAENRADTLVITAKDTGGYEVSTGRSAQRNTCPGSEEFGTYSISIEACPNSCTVVVSEESNWCADSGPGCESSVMILGLNGHLGTLRYQQCGCPDSVDGEPVVVSASARRIR
jgi:hypothetical protein